MEEAEWLAGADPEGLGSFVGGGSWNCVLTEMDQIHL